MGLKSGQLDRRVKLQTKGVTQDSYGGAVVTWSDTATVWAAVEPLQGREFFGAQQIDSEITIRVRIRYRAGVVPAMRVLYGSRVLDIRSVIDPKDRHEELQLMCSEGLTAG
jgi:SPP1 family predicted phage head-tail adaptor